LKRLFLLITVLLFPYLGFADNWTVINTNKTEYPLGYLLQEADNINIQEGEFLMIINLEKKQFAVIIIPGEKTVWQSIEEAKELEQERKNKSNRNEDNLIWKPLYLLYKYTDYMFFWIQW